MLCSRTEWGFHRYAGQDWTNPYEALDYAIKTGDRNPDIEFVFPIADRIDWSVEPEEPLVELYRQRALELRRRYDYLILMYSGGSDSHQVLMAFIDNGIHLDEVRTYWPMKWIWQVEGDPTRDDPLGHLYEYHGAVVPGLQQVFLHSPKTKIKVVDTSDAYDGDMSLWRDIVSIQHRMSGGAHGLYVANFRAAIERDLQGDMGPRHTGVIYGVDKPHVRLAGSNLSVSFPDSWRIGVSHFWTGVSAMFDPVMFFWGDPRITCKQAHIILHGLDGGPRGISDLNWQRHLIYPRWSFPYQSAGINDELLKICAGVRARSIAAERTRYLNDRYASLANVWINDGVVTSQRHLRLMFARESKSYKIGQLAIVKG